MVHLTRTAGPTIRPIDLATAAGWARLDANYIANEPILPLLLDAAIRDVENFTGQSMMTQSWRLALDRFPCGKTIRLPRSPVQSITTIKYLDTSNVEQTLSGSLYDVDDDLPARVYLISLTAYWPSTYQIPNAVWVDYVTGRTDPQDVPETLRLAVAMRFAYLYDNRSEVTLDGSPRELPDHMKRLLRDETIPHFCWED